MKVLVGITGSVASIKLEELLVSLRQQLDGAVDVEVVATKNALKFLTDTKLSVRVWTDDDEWSMWKRRGDPVLHIKLRSEADLLIIAPLDANTLGKFAHGICDNLLTCLMRAWDPAKPMVLCPAMNTFMWKHPVTEQHLQILTKWNQSYYKNNLKIIYPIEKTLMCGDTGVGAMATVEDIVKSVMEITFITK